MEGEEEARGAVTAVVLRVMCKGCLMCNVQIMPPMTALCIQKEAVESFTTFTFFFNT